MTIYRSATGMSISVMILELMGMLRYIRLIWIQGRKRYAVSSRYSIVSRSMMANSISVLGVQAESSPGPSWMEADWKTLFYMRWTESRMY